MSSILVLDVFEMKIWHEILVGDLNILSQPSTYIINLTTYKLELKLGWHTKPRYETDAKTSDLEP